MSRKKRADKRRLNPDARFKSTLVTQLVNVVLRKGKRGKAEQSVHLALDGLKKKLSSKETEVTLLRMALDNIRPSLEVKSRRVGGANYQIPVEVATNRGIALGLRWLVDAAASRSEKDMAERLCAELVQASNNDGNAVRKKVETHKMAEANKAFAHFRF